MSVLPLSANYFEQQRVPPASVPPLTRTWFREQRTEQPMPQAHSEQFKGIQWLETNWQVPLVRPGFQNAFVIGYGPVSAAIDEQIQPLELPTQNVGLRPGGGLFQKIGCYAFNWEGPPDSGLEGLEDEYVIDNRSAVAAFIRKNRIRGLLLQAREPLDAAFGKGPLKKLTLATDDEGCTTLFCLVRVPSEMQEARRALRSFDHRWWLGHSTQAAGKLNFDFELV